jgi:class 3 adenylate cyclase
VKCPSCGKDVPGEFPFCPFCTAPLGDESVVEGLEERKVVSVLFCDLVGSTASADGADPEDVRARIRPYHASLRREIETHGGTVEKFVGDAVMAVFACSSPSLRRCPLRRATRSTRQTSQGQSAAPWRSTTRDSLRRSSTPSRHACLSRNMRSRLAARRWPRPPATTTEAALQYADAAERWRGFGNVPEQAYALLGHGRCLAALRDPNAAEPLRQARGLFESLGYRPALEETEALLADATSLAS